MNEKITMNINHIWAALTVHELIMQGVRQFYIAPGMRNAPLIAALTELKENGYDFNFEVVMDERALAYRALGFSKVTGIASALICTSGTALANFLPAVIEAKKSQVPLIILSADRPHELINSDDNQTIEQTHFYRPWVNYDLNLGDPSEQITPRALATSVSELFFKSLFPNPGPVHMNLMMREPLGFEDTNVSETYKNLALKTLQEKKPATQYEIPQFLLNPKALGQMIYDINKARKGLLVIGSLPNTLSREKIQNFINKLSFSFFLEVGSSLKYAYNLNDDQIPTFDHPEVQQVLKDDPPDLVIHLGGRLTSKFYYQFLSNNPDLNLYVLNSTENKEDPTHTVKKRFVIDLDTTLSQLIDCIENKPRSHYQFGLEEFISNKIKFLENAPLSFPVVSKTFIDIMPENLQILLGNSTAIRTFDSYFSNNIKKHFHVFTNRGVSGIEGFIATALGISDASLQDVFLILGDVSFIHDFNSIFMLNKKTHSFIKIVLLNNGGGAIFTLLPIKKDKNILDIITTPHDFEFSATKLLNENIQYLAAKDRNEYQKGLNWLLNTKSHAILEVHIDDKTNSEVYERLKTIR